VLSPVQGTPHGDPRLRNRCVGRGREAPAPLPGARLSLSFSLGARGPWSWAQVRRRDGWAGAADAAAERSAQVLSRRARKNVQLADVKVRPVAFALVIALVVALVVVGLCVFRCADAGTARQVRACVFAFDLLAINGRPLLNLPLAGLPPAGEAARPHARAPASRPRVLSREGLCQQSSSHCAAPQSAARVSRRRSGSCPDSSNSPKRSRSPMR